MLLISSTRIETLFIAVWIVGTLGILPLTFWSTLRIVNSLKNRCQMMEFSSHPFRTRTCKK